MNTLTTKRCCSLLQWQPEPTSTFTSTLTSTSTSASASEPTSRFLLQAGSEIRLYHAWRQSHLIHHQPIYTIKELPSAKAFDWSTHLDLLAVGTTSGTAFILPLPPHSKSNPTSKLQSISFSASRNSNPRPSTAIAFSSSGNLLALGLEKGRDYGLQIYNVQPIAALFNSDYSNKLDPKTYLEQTPLAYAMSTETITALTFLTVTSTSYQSMLVVVSSSKTIKLYDLRTFDLDLNKGYPEKSTSSHPTIPQVLTPIAQWSAPSVIGVQPDPFDPHRFATWGDDGHVRLWDTRRAAESLILSSEEDVGVWTRPSSARSLKKLAPSTTLTAIHSLTWSKSRKGVILTASVDPQRLRVWDLVEWSPLPPTPPRSRSDPPVSNSLVSRNLAPMALAHANPPSIGLRTHSPQATQTVAIQDPNMLPNYAVFQSRLLKPLNRASQTVVSAQIPTIVQPHSPKCSSIVPKKIHEFYLSLSQDGHLEFFESVQPGEAAFGAKGNMVYSDRMRIRIDGRPSNLVVDEPFNTVSHLRWPAGPPLASAEILDSSHLPSPAHPELGQLTPRFHNDHLDTYQVGSHSNPSSDLKRLHSEVAVLQLANKFGRHLDVATALKQLPSQTDRNEVMDDHLLKNDISAIMMNRACAGYGSNFFRNQRLTSDNPALSVFWEWVAHSQKLFQQGNGLINGYDFSFQGVLSIMKGFSPAGEPHLRPRSLSPHKPTLRTSSVDKKSASCAANQQRQICEYVKAIRTFNHTNQVDNFTISSEFSDQRQTALFLCGSDYNSKDIDQISSKYERLGMYGKASAIAFFSGNTQRAITSLQRSNDTQLKLLAPPLATHLNTQRSGLARDPLFDQVCRQLADDGTTEPYIRAIFAYCSTGDWHEVIDETGLPLKDRIAVALRFLSDDKVFHWLDSVGKDMIKSGDLEGILLTGFIASDGLKLLQNHINRTGDIQTVSLSSYLLVPCRFSSPELERCIQTYRRLLDRWELFRVRIKFDIARGRNAREAAHILASNRQLRTSSNAAQMFPPQLIIKCQHCSGILSDGHNVPTYPSSVSDLLNTNSNLAGMASFKTVGSTPLMRRTNRCPACGKSLRKCSICLTSSDGSKNLTWAWCHLCQHLAHADHLQEWRDRGNLVCPVSGCECCCWEDR